LRIRHQARSLHHVYRKATEAFGESLEMLARQQCRRHHHCDLLAVERHRKGSAQRHLGLAKTDVAADQPVHRPAALEVF